MEKKEGRESWRGREVKKTKQNIPCCLNVFIYVEKGPKGCKANCCNNGFGGREWKKVMRKKKGHHMCPNVSMYYFNLTIKDCMLPRPV